MVCSVQLSFVSCPIILTRGNRSRPPLNFSNWSRSRSRGTRKMIPQALSNDGEDSSDSSSWFWSRRDDSGLYPWDPSADRDGEPPLPPLRVSLLQCRSRCFISEFLFDYFADWIREDSFTFFTTDGLVKIGGSIRPDFLVPSLYRRHQIFTNLSLY